MNRKKDSGMKKLTIPDFESEEQEAQWWDSHQDETADEFERAASEGHLTRGTVARKAASATSIRLDPDDIARARAQAEDRGLRYQTYLKMLIHEALRAVDERKAG